MTFYKWPLRAFWVILLSIRLLYSEETPYVTCNIKGQLGNQLFQIAATLSYAWDNHFIPIFPELNKNELDIGYNRDKTFFRLDASPLPRPWQFLYVQPSYFNIDKIPIHPDQYLEVFFLSWKHFHHHREKILDVFNPSEEINEYLKIKYEELLDHSFTVAVHIRTYSLNVQQRGGLYFLGFDYYERAMNLFPENTLFVIFSDRINWCKHYFSKLNKNIILIEGNTHIQDFFLMSKLKNYIISNSTFSWWAVYLNTLPNKTVVAPTYWFNPKNYEPPLPNTLYFPDWILIDADYEAPYPEDMRSYDHLSQSKDGFDW